MGTARTVLGAIAAAAVLAGGASAQAPAKAPAKAPAGSPAAAPGGAAAAPEGWRKEFDEVCGRTQDAMSLATDELRALVRRCDALKPAMDALGETERKVASRRLRECRNLYQFVLDSREKG